MTIMVKLPPPPSVNALFTQVGKRRIRTRKYKSWARTAAWELAIQKPGRITGAWTAHVVLPKTLKGDIDNRLKGLIDAIVSAGITADDRFLTGLSVEKTGATDNVIVTIKQA